MINLNERTYSDEELFNIIDVIKSDELTMGKNVDKFECMFSKYINSPYSVMVNSGSSANLLMITALLNKSLNKNDIIAVPAVCWSTSISPILLLGLNTVFIDIDIETINMNIDDLKLKMNEYDIKAILCVHILGNCTNMNSIEEICKDNNIILIEDSCETLGSKYDDRYLGTFGDFGTYSFYYSHHMTTIEGGMITMKTFEDYELVKSLRSHGWIRHHSETSRKSISSQYNDIDDRFLFVHLGYNLRPMEIQAVLGISQLERLRERNDNRNYNRNKIVNTLTSSDMFIFPVANCDIDWFGIPMYLKDDRYYKDFIKHLNDNNIENRPIVSGNITRQPFIRDYITSRNIHPESFTGAEYLHKHGLYIGCSSIRMTDDEIQSLCDIISNFKCLS